MSKTVQELTDKNFDQTLKEHDIVVVDFYATWCGPCKVVAPIFEELVKEMPNVTFVKLDVDDNEKAVAKFGIESIPTIILFRNGEKLDEFVGAASKLDIKNWIKETLKPPLSEEPQE